MKILLIRFNFVLSLHLSIHGHGVKAVVHDVHPAVLAGQDEEAHKSLAEVVKVVSLVPPPVPGVRQTVRLGRDVLAFISNFIFSCESNPRNSH